MGDTSSFNPRNAPITYNCVAAFTFIVWDWIITLDEEVVWIWLRRGRLTWVRCVYIFNRYIAILYQSVLLYQRLFTKPNHFSGTACHVWYSLRVLAAPIFTLSIQTILIARVRALYHCNAFVVRTIYCIFVLESIVLISCALAIPPFIELNAFCIPREASIGKAIYVSLNTLSFLFDLVLFGLTFYKVICLSRRRKRHVPLLQQLLKDGTWAFLVLCVTFFVNQLIALIGPKGFRFAFSDWLIAVISFTSSRLILNILAFDRIAPEGGAHHLLNNSGNDADTASCTRELGDDVPITTHVELEMGLFTQHCTISTNRTTGEERELKSYQCSL